MRIYTKNNNYNVSDPYIYQNYHKHSVYTNPIVTDSCAYPVDYAKRADELKHTILSSCEHGWQGRYIEYYELTKDCYYYQKDNEKCEKCDKKLGSCGLYRNELKFLFAVEAYMVLDRFEKDNTNAHLVIAAKNENGRKAINRILSEANLTGYYYRARVDYELLMQLPEDDVWITSACLGGLNKYTNDSDKSEEILLALSQHTEYDSPYEMMIDKLHQKFKDNFFLEVQAHNVLQQKEWNLEIVRLSKKYSIEIIAGVDSHYIYEEDAWKRDYLQKSSGIFMEEEQGFYMDYPDGKTLFRRFQTQGALTDEEIFVAMNNTNVFLQVEEYTSPIFNHDLKMPSAIKYRHMTKQEKQQKLMKIVKDSWEVEKQNIPQEKHEHYLREIIKELDTIFKINHEDYFLLNYEIIKDAVENRGGMITFSGRGSGPSFYVNHLLGFTQIDRIASPITLYPERFLSTSRMQAGSLADIDFNCGNTPVFEDSQKYIMGENNAYPMVAYGTQKPKAAWKMFCRAVDVPFDIANSISEKITEYETDLKYWDEDSGEDEPNIKDYIPAELKEYFDKSKEFLGIVVSASRHPCFVAGTKVLTNKGYKNIEDIEKGDFVLSHDNDFHQVIDTMINDGENLYELKTGCCENIKVTGSHPMYVRHKEKEYSNPEWVDVEDLKPKDVIGVAVNKNSIVPQILGIEQYCSNPNFWWFIGRFVGDGWIEKIDRKVKIEYRIKLCCDNTNDDELNIIKQKLNNLFEYRVEKHRTSYKFIIKNNKYLFEFLQRFGKYAYGKHLVPEVFDLPISLLSEFLNGYLSADGCFYEKIKQYSFSTVSEQLFYDLQICIHKVYKQAVLVHIRKAQQYVIEGRLVNGRKQYQGRFYIENSRMHRQNFYEDGYIWTKIRSLTKIEDKEKVYNLSVAKTNSYNVYGLICHNCGNLLYTDNDITEEFGIARLKSKGGKETIVACCDGGWIEHYLMLKNDLLTVACVKLNYLLYERIGLKHMSLNGLLEECRQHPEVWTVYEKGYTIGLNQVEKSSTKRKIMRYKPKNISELSAFIAGIRPAFKSLLEKLVNREHFEYGIPTLDKLLQTEELPESFILYQEQIMKILAFAGIPMGDCYTVIKSISKKRFAKIMHYKEQFLVGIAQKLIEEEQVSETRANEVANTIWKIIEDASAYGFNSSHSLSVSFDSLLAAYFKALYPIEFYEVYLNLQMTRSDKAKALLATKEMKDAFDIKLLPMRFGQDNRKYTAMNEINSLTNCLKSIKGFGDIVGEELFRLARHKYNDFLELLIAKRDYVKLYPLEVWEDYTKENMVADNINNEIIKCLKIYEEQKDNKDFKVNKKPLTLKNVFSLSEVEGLYNVFEQSKPYWKIAVNDTQMETLIMLNYFEDFGYNNKLMQIFKLFCNYYGGVQLKKSEVDKKGLNMEVLLKYIHKETEALYKDIDYAGYIRELAEGIPNQYVALPKQLKFERELLEIPIFQNPQLPQTWNYVLGYKTYGDKVNNPYVILYNLNNGTITSCKVQSSKFFRDEPFGIYSIINVTKIEDVPKKKNVDGKWVVTNEMRTVLKTYEVVLRDKSEEIKEVLKDE